MDDFFKIKWEKTKYFIVFSVTLLLLIVTVSHYQNEEVPINKKEIIAYREHSGNINSINELLSLSTITIIDILVINEC